MSEVSINLWHRLIDTSGIKFTVLNQSNTIVEGNGIECFPNDQEICENTDDSRQDYDLCTCRFMKLQ